MKNSSIIKSSFQLETFSESLLSNKSSFALSLVSIETHSSPGVGCHMCKKNEDSKD